MLLIVGDSTSKLSRVSETVCPLFRNRSFSTGFEISFLSILIPTTLAGPLLRFTNCNALVPVASAPTATAATAATFMMGMD